MSFDVYSYRLGKRSVDRLVERLSRVLGDEATAELAGILAGARDCQDVEQRLDFYFAWQSLRWAYEPSGLPPSAKKEMLVAAICREGIPVDEEFLEALSRPGEESVEGEVE